MASMCLSQSESQAWARPISPVVSWRRLLKAMIDHASSLLFQTTLLARSALINGSLKIQSNRRMKDLRPLLRMQPPCSNKSLLTHLQGQARIQMPTTSTWTKTILQQSLLRPSKQSKSSKKVVSQFTKSQLFPRLLKDLKCTHSPLASLFNVTSGVWAEVVI